MNASALSDVRDETIIPPKPRSTAYSATSLATTRIPRIDSDAAFAGANFEMHKHAAAAVRTSVKCPLSRRMVSSSPVV